MFLRPSEILTRIHLLSTQSSASVGPARGNGVEACCLQTRTKLGLSCGDHNAELTKCTVPVVRYAEPLTQR